MNAGPSSDRPGGEFHPGDDLDPRHEAVERLLGRAPMPEPDAWFAARTLARCRSEKLETVSFARVWRWALGGGLGICLAVSLLAVQVKQVVAPVAPAQDSTQQKSVQEAFEIMASSDNSDADTTSSPASSTSWQDSSL